MNGRIPGNISKAVVILMGTTGLGLLVAGLLWWGTLLLLAGIGATAYWIVRASDAASPGRHSAPRKRA